jgi:signal transduction histidine kinase
VNGVPEAAPARVRPDGTARLDPGAARELTRHLGAIASCLHVLADGGRSLREQVLTDLARTELFRATAFVQGLQVLGEDPVLARRNLRLVDLLEQALASVEPERRLAGVEASLDVAALDVGVTGDERWLVCGLAGMASALLAAMQTYRVRGARLEVGGSATVGTVTVEMTQDVVTFPPALLARFFDLGWIDRPGGPAAAVPLAAAARVAELHGGKAAVDAGPRGGCRLTLTLPRSR